MTRRLVVTAAVLGSALLACQTQQPVQTDGLSPLELFQGAQDASEEHNYRRAMSFYEQYLERFPAAVHAEELERNLWAEYEIAFLHHKLGDDATAVELLHALVARYENDEEARLPPAPGVLAKRVAADLAPPERGEPAPAGATVAG